MNESTPSSSPTASKIADKLRSALKSVIQGKDETIDLIVCCLLVDGHVLLEDYPGSGKTTLAKTLGRLIDTSSNPNTLSSSTLENHIASFRRIQFTPDMLPGDVLGVNIFEPKTATFKFIHGPVFSHILLADELNRTGPKVQSAFLECMAEKQVTTDNVTFPLDDLFFVIGTQNPLDIAGTYPLPLVQLDRFMCRIPMSYVDKSYEIKILAHADEIREQSVTISPVVTREEVLQARDTTKSVYIKDNLREAIVNIVQATRNNPMLQFGASTRSAIMLQSAIKGWAVVQGRDFVTEDDLVFMAPYVLLHRLKFHPGAGDNKEALRRIMAPAVERLVG